MLLAEEAHASIVADCLDHLETEIGGVLPGRRIDDSFVVPFSIPAGPAARCTPSRFTPDQDWQQVLLNYLHSRFAVDYVGDWHRHPGLFDEPSSYDLRTAREIVTDRTWNKTEALFPIAVIDEGQVRLRAYLMRRETLEFEELPIVVVADDHPLMTALLTGTKANSKEETLAKPQPQQTRRVRRRIGASRIFGELTARLRGRPRE